MERDKRSAGNDHGERAGLRGPAGELRSRDAGRCHHRGAVQEAAQAANSRARAGVVVLAPLGVWGTARAQRIGAGLAH